MIRAALWALPFCYLPVFAHAAPLKLTVEKAAPVTFSARDRRAVRREIRHTPGAASLVTEDAFRPQRNTTIKDLLDYVPGVTVQPRNGAEASRLSIRGSGLTRTFQGRGLLILQDGIPINTADGGFDFQQIDPWLVESAEVLRGANAVRQGASTLGGAIELSSPTGQTAPGLLLRSEAGSFGTVHGQVGAGWQRAATDAYATAIGFSQDGFRDQNAQESGRFAGNAGWLVSPDVETRFFVSRLDSDAEIPGSLTRRQLYDRPRQANRNNIRGDYARALEVTRLGNQTTYDDGESRAVSTLYWQYQNLDNPVTTYITRNSNDVGWRGSVERAVGSAGTVLGGVNLAYGKAYESRYANLSGRPGAKVLEREEDAFTGETYLQYEHAVLPDTFLIGSGQVSYALRGSEEESPGMESRDRNYTGFNPRIGIRHELTPDIQLFSNISRSFEPPTFSELSATNRPGFSDLDAQKATMVEVGSRGEVMAAQWDLALYHAWVRDEFVTTRFPDGATETTNADKAIRRGVEAGLTAPLAESVAVPDDAVTLRLAYTLNDFHLDDDPRFGDNILPGVPRHILRAESLYAHPSGFRIGPNIEWVPEDAPIDLANSVYASEFALLGLRADYAPTPRLLFYIDGKNLLDRDYSATYGVIPDARGRDQSQFFPGEGRAIYAGLSVKL